MRHLLLLLAIGLALASGCMKKMPRTGGMNYALAEAPAMMAPATPSPVAADAVENQARMLIWRAYLDVQVWNLSNAVARATDQVRQAGGYVEREYASGETSFTLTLRVPQAAFSNLVYGLGQLGDVVGRNISSDDVTAEYVDTEARLKNMRALRDRLRELLAKATEVKDLLAIETELGRIQGEIESMEARLRVMKGQVDRSEINLTLTRKPVLGPLGYVFKGIYWSVSKLFVIRP